MPHTVARGGTLERITQPEFALLSRCERIVTYAYIVVVSLLAFALGAVPVALDIGNEFVPTQVRIEELP